MANKTFCDICGRDTAEKATKGLAKLSIHPEIFSTADIPADTFEFDVCINCCLKKLNGLIERELNKRGIIRENP